MFYVFVKQIYAQRVLIFSFPSVGWSVGRPVFAKPINLNCVLWIFSIFQSHGIRFSKKLKEKLRPKTQTQAATRPTSEKCEMVNFSRRNSQRTIHNSSGSVGRLNNDLPYHPRPLLVSFLHTETHTDTHKAAHTLPPIEETNFFPNHSKKRSKIFGGIDFQPRRGLVSSLII